MKTTTAASGTVTWAPENTWVGDGPPYPWDLTAPSAPFQPKNPWPTSTDTYTIPPVPPHPAECEEFEEFVIWLCGFTDPDNPPSKKRWNEFQKRVQELAGLFVEFKKAKREAERLGNTPYTPQVWYGNKQF